MKKKKKLLMFRMNGLNGLSVDPHSVVAWLYGKGNKKLAEDFSDSINRILKVFQKKEKQEKQPKFGTWEVKYKDKKEKPNLIVEEKAIIKPKKFNLLDFLKLKKNNNEK